MINNPDTNKMTLTHEQQTMLKDNGFSFPGELIDYRNYDPNRKGCNLENRSVFRSGEENTVHCEYEMLDLLMEIAHGTMGREWKLVCQELESGLELSQDDDVECPYYVDVLTIQLPGRLDEKYFFDVTAWYLSIDRFKPGGEFYEETLESGINGFIEPID